MDWNCIVNIDKWNGKLVGKFLDFEDLYYLTKTERQKLAHYKMKVEKCKMKHTLNS